MTRRFPTHTYTLAKLEVLPSTYADIKSRLLAANYDHAIDDSEEMIDMTGIGLSVAEDPDPDLA